MIHHKPQPFLSQLDPQDCPIILSSQMKNLAKFITVSSVSHCTQVPKGIPDPSSAKVLSSCTEKIEAFSVFSLTFPLFHLQIHLDLSLMFSSFSPLFKAGTQVCTPRLVSSLWPQTPFFCLHVVTLPNPKLSSILRIPCSFLVFLHR